MTLKWRHNERDGVSNHRRLGCFLSRLFRRRSTKTSKLLVTGLCAGNSPVTGEFPAQKASNAKNVFHLMTSSCMIFFLLNGACHSGVQGICPPQKCVGISWRNTSNSLVCMIAVINHMGHVESGLVVRVIDFEANHWDPFQQGFVSLITT